MPQFGWVRNDVTVQPGEAVAIIGPAGRRRVHGEAGDLGAERLAYTPHRCAEAAADPRGAPPSLRAGGDAIRRWGLVQQRQRRWAVGGRHVRNVVPITRLRLLDPSAVRFGDHDAAAHETHRLCDAKSMSGCRRRPQFHSAAA